MIGLGIELNARVRIIDADIEGRVTERRTFTDHERWTVEYWHDGLPREAVCEACELEPIE